MTGLGLGEQEGFVAIGNIQVPAPDLTLEMSLDSQYGGGGILRIYYIDKLLYQADINDFYDADNSDPENPFANAAAVEAWYNSTGAGGGGGGGITNGLIYDADNLVSINAYTRQLKGADGTAKVEWDSAQSGGSIIFRNEYFSFCDPADNVLFAIDNDGSISTFDAAGGGSENFYVGTGEVEFYANNGSSGMQFLSTSAEDQKFALYDPWNNEGWTNPFVLFNKSTGEYSIGTNVTEGNNNYNNFIISDGGGGNGNMQLWGNEAVRLHSENDILFLDSNGGGVQITTGNTAQINVQSDGELDLSSGNGNAINLTSSDNIGLNSNNGASVDMNAAGDINMSAGTGNLQMRVYASGHAFIEGPIGGSRGSFFDIDFSENGLVTMGDSNAVANSFTTVVDDNNQLFRVVYGGQGYDVFSAGANGNGSLVEMGALGGGGQGTMVSVNDANNTVDIGDVHNANSGVKMRVDTSGGPYGFYFNAGMHCIDAYYYGNLYLPNIVTDTVSDNFVMWSNSFNTLTKAPLPAGFVPAHQLFTPLTGQTATIQANKTNIINPAGTIAALTVSFPSSPANNDSVQIKFTQAVTAITYSGGTIQSGATSAVAGTYMRFVYDSGSNKWY